MNKKPQNVSRLNLEIYVKSSPFGVVFWQGEIYLRRVFYFSEVHG